MLANGDKRDCFVVVDQAGGHHALNKKLTGHTLAETRDRLADLDRTQDMVPQGGWDGRIQFLKTGEPPPMDQVEPQRPPAATTRTTPATSSVLVR